MQPASQEMTSLPALTACSCRVRETSNSRKARVVALTGWVILSSNAFAGAFTNGSFELPAGQPPMDLPPGSTTLQGWTVGGAGGPVYWGNNAAGFPAVDGSLHIAFNGGQIQSNTAPGTWIAQTFDTQVGVDYKVTFYVGRTGGGSGDLSLTATAKTQAGTILGQTVASAPTQGYGDVQQFVFAAASTTTTLEFLDTSTATVAVDILLDNVIVTPLADAQNTHRAQFVQAQKQYFTTPDSSSLSVTGDLTIEAWINFSSLPAGAEDPRFICGKYGIVTYERSYALWFVDGKIELRINISGNQAENDNAGLWDFSPVPGQWYHVAMSFNAAAHTAMLYINGNLVGVRDSGASRTSIHDGDAPFQIGNLPDYPELNRAFDGSIDEVRVWGAVRTQAQVQAAMMTEFSGAQAGLRGYWKLNNFMADSSGNGNTLSNVNGVTFHTDDLPALTGMTFGLLSHYRFDDNTANDSSGNGNHGVIHSSPQFVPGAVGNGIKLNGTNDWVDIGPDPLLDTFTFAAWVRADAIPQSPINDFIIIADGSTTSDRYSLSIRDNGKFRGSTGSSGSGSIYSTTSPSIGQFYHVAFTREADGMARLYVNGVLEASSNFGPIGGGGAPDLQLGSIRGGMAFFNGVIDDARIYNRALSASEVAALLKHGITGTVSDNSGESGMIFVEARSGAFVTATQLTGPANYSLLVPDGSYTITAYRDVNGNNVMDTWEPQAVFSGNPLTVAGADFTGVNFDLQQPAGSAIALYHVTGLDHVLVDLGTLGGTETHPAAINNSGTVVGWSYPFGDFRRRPLVWDSASGAATLFNETTDAIATDINNQGWVTGWNSTTGFAYVWKGSSLTTFTGPGGEHPSEINDAGIVVGSYGTYPGHAFRFDGQATDALPELGSGNTTAAEGINSSGVIVGLTDGGGGLRVAAMWQNNGATITNIGGRGEASSINDQNVVVGGDNGAWIWKDGIRIGLPSLGDVSDAYANAINNPGVIVGESSGLACQWSDANGDGVFSQGEVLDLNNVVAPNSGWVLNRVTAINDQGAMVGEGTHSAKTRGFLLARKGILAGSVSHDLPVGGVVRVQAARFAETVADANGNYRFDSLPLGIAYWPTAYVDLNGDGIQQSWEPGGVYPSGSLLLTQDQNNISFGFSMPLDSDGDGMPNVWEIAYGLNPSVNDGLLDMDSDEINNTTEYRLGLRPDLQDSNGDGIGDYSRVFTFGLRSSSLDTDGDGMSDLWEIANALNPLANDAGFDPDGDGLTNAQEYNGGVNSTNPRNRDSDGNGVGDYEQRYGEKYVAHRYDRLDRLVSTSYDNGAWEGWRYDGNGNILRHLLRVVRDADSDGLPDAWEFSNGLSFTSSSGTQGFGGDADGDGWTNYQEFLADTGANNASNVPPASSGAVVWANPPTSRIIFPPLSGGAWSQVKVRLWDAEANNAQGALQWYDSTLSQWRAATVLEVNNGPASGLSSLATSPSGQAHDLVWDALSDLGASFNGTILLRTTAQDAAGATNSEAVPYTVNTTGDFDGDGMPDAWEIARSLDPNSNAGTDGTTGDGDHDGLNNFGEFVFNLSLSASDAKDAAAMNTAINPADGKRYLTLTYRRRLDAVPNGLTYSVQTTTDLTAWATNGSDVEPVSTTPSGDGVTELVTVRISPPLDDSGVKKFARVLVTK